MAVDRSGLRFQPRETLSATSNGSDPPAASAPVRCLARRGFSKRIPKCVLWKMKPPTTIT